MLSCQHYTPSEEAPLSVNAETFCARVSTTGQFNPVGSKENVH